MIYCIGNSHANFFTGSPPGTSGTLTVDTAGIFASFSLGPIISYNFTQHHFPRATHVISNIPNFSLEKDYIMFIVGEVDCRWHLPLQANQQQREVEDVVEECVDRFFESMVALKNKNYNVIGWGGHPSTTSGHDTTPHSPVYGDCLYRNKITRQWVKHLGDLCGAHNIPFVSLVHDLIDEDGLTKMEYFQDYCHLKTPPLLPMVIEKIKKTGVKC